MLPDKQKEGDGCWLSDYELFSKPNIKKTPFYCKGMPHADSVDKPGKSTVLQPALYQLAEWTLLPYTNSMSKCTIDQLVHMYPATMTYAWPVKR